MSLLKTALNRLTKEILKRPGHFNTEELVAAGALRSKVTEKMLAANDLANPYHNTYNYE